MSLQFVLGGSGSGKTRFFINLKIFITFFLKRLEKTDKNRYNIVIRIYT